MEDEKCICEHLLCANCGKSYFPQCGEVRSRDAAVRREAFLAAERFCRAYAEGERKLPVDARKSSNSPAVAEQIAGHLRTIALATKEPSDG